MEYVADHLDNPQKDIIEHRLEILKFFDEFGSGATKKAFQKSRSTIYLWKQELAKAGGKLSVLSPGNQAPLHRRKRIINPFIAEFIIDYRTRHPRADKTTITPALTAACVKTGVKPVSESTVGRIIHDLKERGSLPENCRLRMFQRWSNDPGVGTELTSGYSLGRRCRHRRLESSAATC